MERINTMNLDKFVEAFAFIGKGPCQEFNCSRQKACAEEEVECKAFRYWVNNDSYDTMRKGKKTSIAVDMERLLKPIE